MIFARALDGLQSTLTAMRDRVGCAVTGEPDDTDVVAEILATELRADAHLPGQLEDLLFPLEVAERMAGGMRSLRRWGALSR